jgi:hypothetical protein
MKVIVCVPIGSFVIGRPGVLSQNVLSPRIGHFGVSLVVSGLYGCQAVVWGIFNPVVFPDEILLVILPKLSPVCRQSLLAEVAGRVGLSAAGISQIQTAMEQGRTSKQARVVLRHYKALTVCRHRRCI